jgi:16S rRNA (guanine527-N7)-methyltransferase
VSPRERNGRRDAAGPRRQAAHSLDRFGFVTPAIRDDLERFVGLLRTWQRTHNLVSHGDLAAIWERHVADSLQLAEHAPGGWRQWVDLGSGAGFPGLVVAIVEKGRVPFSHRDKAPATRPDANRVGARQERADEGWEPRARLAFASNPSPVVSQSETTSSPSGRGSPLVTLVESNLKKAAFLRAAIRETGAPAEVAAERIERHAAKMKGQADVVSARALAPLPELLQLAEPYLHQKSVVLLLKGQDFVHEHEAASKAWDYDMVSIPSVTNPGGHLVAIRHVRRRPA